MDYSLILGGCAGAALVAGGIAAKIWWRRGRAARKGKQGEKQVAKVIAKLKKRDFICFNDVLLPSSGWKNTSGDKDYCERDAYAVATSQIDHILVSTRGIFVIETKSHIGKITGSEQAQYWEQRLSGQSRSFYNPLLQNASHVKVLKKLLPFVPDEAFVSVIVFTEASGLNIKADKIVMKRRLLTDKIIDRTLIPSERVVKKWWNFYKKEIRLDESKIVLFLDNLLEELKRRKKILTRDEIKEIAEMVENFSINDRKTRKGHIQYAKNTAKNISREIRNGICPRCGGMLVVRKTGNGDFLGCENFPRCRFTCRYDS
ncbi:MAG: NERD domain-containing protein [Muribaculaceae bacterium]|nr:NERD domain-containing protein [Muribaculaceae bacterium]